ncbi:MAG: AI-2E family transporter [bacterium]
MTSWRTRVREPRTWVFVSILVFTLVVVVWFSQALVPVVAAGVVAYLLDGLVERFERLKLPRVIAVIVVIAGTLLFLALLLFSVLPTVAEQLNALANQVPRLVTSVEEWLVNVQASWPQFFRGGSAQEFVDRLNVQLQDQLGRLITILLAWAGGAIGNSVNTVIVVFLVFFILKDKEEIWNYLKRLIPGAGHPKVTSILADIDQQMGQFIKGKFIVVFVLFLLSTIAFMLIGLNFFLLLGILTGLSTFIPYVGAIVVALPVVATGFIQWGTFTGGVGTLLVYMAVQAVDANYLTPVIIGRETSIHPVAIILAILICGTLWGFWGVFFAVPIAVVVKSVLDQVYFPAREGTLGEPHEDTAGQEAG